MSVPLAYFSRIERLFIELRGSPLLLSPADWQVAEGWWESGIPLPIVEAALRELFAERAASGAKKVPGLRYCSRAVRRKWEEQRALSAGSGRSQPMEIDLPGRLAELCRRCPQDLAERRQLVARIEQLSVLEDPEEVEGRLSALDRELLDELAAALVDADRRELDAAVEALLRPLAAKLSDREHARLRDERRRELVRRRFKVPVLSLFDD